MVKYIKKYIDSKIKKKVIIMDNRVSLKSSQVKSTTSHSKNTLLYSISYIPKLMRLRVFYDN